MLEKHISQENLAVQILNQPKSHFTRKLSYSKVNPNYLLTKEIINKWIKALKINNCYSSITKEIIDKYNKYNNLSSKRIYLFINHPNFYLDYFKVIDSKEKAYWLGWLYAEGNIYKKKDGQLILSVQIDVKDGILIKRFINAIGFNPKRVEYSKRIKYNNDEELYLSRTFRVRIRNRLFAENLMNYGFPVGKKASKIRFPLLKSKDFDLAFLLGFFDGDGYISHSKFGKVKEIKIFSKSRLFLSDVKSRFELEYKIGQNKGRKKDGTTTYLNTLNLGFSLYKKTITNYEKSLPRKRFDIHQSQIERQLSKKYGIKRFKFSQKELKNLILKYTLQQIADIHEKRFGITIHHTTVMYWRDKWI